MLRYLNTEASSYQTLGNLLICYLLLSLPFITVIKTIYV